MPCPFSLRPAWAEINLDNLIFNLKEFRRRVGPKVKIMAVVKADGYGHGAVEVAQAAADSGCDYLGVGFLDEGIELRKAGINTPILILGYTPPEQAGQLLHYKLVPTVFSPDLAQILAREAQKRGEKARVHVKVDTGMGRLGIFTWQEGIDFVRELSSWPSLEVEGFYTHFAAADERDKTFTLEQLSRFKRVIEMLSREGIEIPLKHAANSAASIDLSPTHLDMIRLGISLYGLYPSAEVEKERVNLKPVMCLKARIIHLKKVPPGTSISYGRTYITREETWIASLPLGYGDGYSRLITGKGQVLIRGHRYPIVGRICMDQMMVDLGKDPPPVEVGEEVVIMGEQGSGAVPAEEIAGWLGTINYEVTCAVSKRIPRVYLRDNKIKAARTLLGKIEF
ncbi:MAG: alanine racemase [Candidatus Syntrophonatronum acetioxidans]|uniref:Alanine racemase n=1 Tax=Candidatus Syntrophonatronum acetioxidans TaxID=1795816 RepID=A0A424YA36_9FIRM|nr:MAG: alanine racemase [Candidatus Syntrophonatronum acetioxidans]